MDFPQRGGCQCGAIRYEISGPPRVVYACHCTECQQDWEGLSVSERRFRRGIGSEMEG